jgi:hypothetical protein
MGTPEVVNLHAHVLIEWARTKSRNPNVYDMLNRQIYLRQKPQEALSEQINCLGTFQRLIQTQFTLWRTNNSLLEN